VNIPLDEVLYFDAITSDSTGAVTDADSTPTWSIFEEATDTPILENQNFTKRTGLTGNYRGAATLSAANGFEAGKWYVVIATGIVDTITGKAVVKSFRVVPAESAAGVPKVDACYFAGQTITAAAGVTMPASVASSALLTTQMTESYAADGVAPTPEQALFATLQRLTEFSISGTTLTVKKLDGSTTAYTLTLNDATSPTSSTRAT
jgi:hypothetical protein